ncbi:hypothetical protein HPB48_027144 [Haemaphysalis longicornis]|uniref:PiggyBac transposable element-derived protein domain-containing protein n=1 Tax=Haemaphysalis longicornis TaxID=44386 RepID=A0A9J6HDX8_HAELO|nr:hypothetical protein HPB48_027144 [Haemaphysalis longicornis]
MRFLHFADNTSLTLSDQLTKLRPLMTLPKAKFQHHFQPVRQLSYEESMIEYYGRHGCKQFIRGQPIRFGYKVWCLNAKNAYFANFQVYQGKQKDRGTNTQYEKEFRKAAAPLLEMVYKLPVEIRDLPYHFYFNNLFTSLHLLRHLKEKNYGATTTVTKNRVPKKFPIARPDITKCKTRGYEKHALSNYGILIVRWMDNSVVAIASTVHGIEAMSSADRYSPAHKKRIKVPRPNAVTQYNCFMGGTNQMDPNVGAYRIAVRGKKWWFTWLRDVAIGNSWVLIRSTGSEITNFNFGGKSLKATSQDGTTSQKTRSLTNGAARGQCALRSTV